jgi:hypothetical protein
MLRILLEQGLSYKVGAMTAGSNILFGTLTSLAWVGANLAQIGLGLSALLTITLIISHICKTIRDNKASREISRQKEVEMELDLKDSDVLLRRSEAEIEDLKRKTEVSLRKSEVEIEELKLRVLLLKLELREKEEDNNKE